MNSDQWLGFVQIWLGRMEEVTGTLLSSERLQRRGFENRITGEARKAVGEAQSLIAVCRRKSQRSANAAVASPYLPVMPSLEQN